MRKNRVMKRIRRINHKKTARTAAIVEHDVVQVPAHEACIRVPWALEEDTCQREDHQYPCGRAIAGGFQTSRTRHHEWAFLIALLRMSPQVRGTEVKLERALPCFAVKLQRQFTIKGDGS